MQFREDDLVFEFPDRADVIKLDDTNFYRNCYEIFDMAKAVDFVIKLPDRTCFMEIKDFTDREAKNRWRLAPNNARRASQMAHIGSSSEESLDLEAFHKFLSSLLCVYGAWTMSEQNEQAKDLLSGWQGMTAAGIPSDKAHLDLLVYVDGDFAVASRTARMCMKSIRDSIDKKLRGWLKCRVRVVNKETMPGSLFSVQRAGRRMAI